MEKNQKDPGRPPQPGPLEPSGLSPGVSELELWELECGFVELHLLLFKNYTAAMLELKKLLEI
jgi:hypothetical protein